MAIGLTWEEAGLAMGYNKSVNALQRQAQAIIDEKDAEIIRLRRVNAALKARVDELESESLDRKRALLRLHVQ